MAHAHPATTAASTTAPRHRISPAGVAGILVQIVVALLGLVTVAAGIWSFADPHSFARWVQFPVHVHFLHDLGAFQIGIGVTLLLALLWRDGIAVALGGFFTGNTLHVLSHLVDLDLGGRSTDWLLIATLSVVAFVALLARLRQLARTDIDRDGDS